MVLKVSIRKECKSRWERRAPLSPDVVQALTTSGISVSVQRSKRRIFPEEAYQAAGATLIDACRPGEIVMGIKEPELDEIQPNQVHVAFSHTFKGQAQNMPLLRRLMEQGCTLIDYETITDEKGARLVAFGRFAGIAGTVDSLHILGKKLALMGVPNVLEQIRMTHGYESIEVLRTHLMSLAPIEEELLRVIVVGSGNVGGGCLEVCQWLGLPRIPSQALLLDSPPPGPWYTLLHTRDIVRHREGGTFDFDDFVKHGQDKYDSIFTQYLGSVNLLLEAGYWQDNYPRHLTHEELSRFSNSLPLVIGDITCDIDGCLACTQAPTTIDQPAATYDPESRELTGGISMHGPTIMAIDHLPCELPRDASQHFSANLAPYMTELVNIDLDQPLDGCGLPRELRQATILYKGELTANYQYLLDYL